MGEPGWAFWELRTLNMHRVVGLLHECRQFANARDFQATIGGVVSHNFKCSWWRGMGFGVVAEVAVISLGADDLKIRDFLATGNDFREPLCRRSYGIALNEPVEMKADASRRLYVFNNHSWSPRDVAFLEERIFK